MSDSPEQQYEVLLAQQLKELQGYLISVQEQSEEVSEGLRALDVFSTCEQGLAMRVPVINGLYVEAELQDSECVYVDVGSGVIVKKSVSDAHRLLKERLQELLNVQEQLSEQFSSLYSEYLVHQHKEE